MTGHRGQTEFDYLVGMTLLLLTITGVFLFVPSILQSFQDPVDGAEKASAERVADDLLSQHAVSGTSNTLVYDDLNQSLTSGIGSVGSSGQSVNVSLTNDTGIVTSSGSPFANTDSVTATTVRVVQLADDSAGRCDPACRLIVRVW